MFRYVIELLKTSDQEAFQAGHLLIFHRKILKLGRTGFCFLPFFSTVSKGVNYSMALYGKSSRIFFGGKGVRTNTCDLSYNVIP